MPNLAPFYDRVERSLGLVGNADGIAHLPDPIPGPPVAPTPVERHLGSSIGERWPNRRLVTRRTAPPPVPIDDARATRRLTLRHSAVARGILIDPCTGRARGVAWVEAGREREATARVVVLAASTIESTRLLLNSRSRHHPDGVGNSSGLLGRFLMDHAMVFSCEGILPSRAAADPQRTCSAYIPRFRNLGERSPGFLRGYGVQVLVTGRTCILNAFGEMLPRETNRVTIDPDRRDRWGIPVARIACEHSDNERAQTADAVEQCREMLLAAGCENPRGAGGRDTRPRDSRGRDGPRGPRPEDLGARPLQPVLGRTEPVRGGRVRLRLAGHAEPDAHDDGPRPQGLRAHRHLVPPARL